MLNGNFLFDPYLASAQFPPFDPANAEDCVLKVLGPEAGELRTRDVVSRSNSRSTSKYPSVKMRRAMQAESDGECIAFRIFDADPSVKGFHEQRKVILFRLDGVTHRHYPDIEVERHGEQFVHLCEVKPLANARDPFIVARTRLLRSQLPRFGYAYHLILTEDLKKHPFLASATTLHRYGYHRIDDEVIREQVRRVLKERRVISWTSAQTTLGGLPLRSILCSLTLEGVLDFDRNGPLNAHTHFYMAAASKVA